MAAMIWFLPNVNSFMYCQLGFSIEQGRTGHYIGAWISAEAAPFSAFGLWMAYFGHFLGNLGPVKPKRGPV